jgi:hypothetical protein
VDEIKPLLESSSNSLTRDLLRSALPDAPHPRAIGRAAVALGATLTTATAAAGASSSLATGLSGAKGMSVVSSATAAQSGLGGMVAKWLVVGMASGGLVAGGASLLGPREPAPSAHVRVSDPAVRPPESAKPPATRAWVEAAPPAANTETPAAPATPVPDEAQPSNQFRKGSGKLSREVELIDGARKAVAASDAQTALAALERYERVRETGTLDREARLLRIDALILRGDRPLASELARRYLQDFPNDAHAARLREFLVKGK